MAYPRQHKLDGIYFHIKRDDEYKDICFSDLTRDEQYSIMTNKDKSWLIEKSKQSSVWGKAGIIESIVLCDGEITAVWRKKGNAVLLKLLQKCSEDLICKIKNAICERFNNSVDVRIVNEFRCV